MKAEKKEDKDRRYLFEFQLYFGAFTRLLCSEECLPGLFECNHFSQIKRLNALVVFVVDKSKVVFILLVSAVLAR